MYRILFGKKNTAELVTKIADHVATNMTATGVEKVVVAEKAAKATVRAAEIKAKASKSGSYARAGASILSAGGATLAAYKYFKPVEEESIKLRDEMRVMEGKKYKDDLYILEQDATIDSLESLITEIKQLIPKELESSVRKLEESSNKECEKKIQRLRSGNGKASSETNSERGPMP